MIIRNYREITKRKDVAVVRADEDSIAHDYMQKFNEFHLDERSRQRLISYFRYLLRKGKIEQKLSYNFMLHCGDKICVEEFVAVMTETVNAICGTMNSAAIFSEEVFLQKPADVIGAMEKGGIVMIDQCLPLEKYAPLDSGSKGEIIKRERDVLWNKYIQKCEKTPDTCKIIAAPEAVLRERFRGNEHLYFRIMRNHIYIEGMSPEEVYGYVLKELEKSGISYSEEFSQKLKQYIQVVYPKADLKNRAFVTDLLERILTSFYGQKQNIDELTQEFVPYYKKNRNYEEILAAMDELVGLEKVKETFMEIPYMLQESSKESVPSLHMAFVGNAGTGKTTVARLAAELLYSMGVIQKNKVVSVSALDLIGRYVGETPRLTKEYCKKAYGGVLFIDEAYLISKSKNGSTNDQVKEECIGTLLQEMENNRDHLLVIFAGYPKEMESFIHDSNSGLASRLYKIVEFEDYSDDELVQIFENMCKKDQFQITARAKEKVRLKLGALRYSRNFGNARTVRNVYSEAKKEYRQSKESDNKILEEKHIVLDTELKDYDLIKAELDEMIGLETAKAEVSRTIETCRFSKESGVEVPISKHMLFLGNAGTGKSTVAKLFSQMMFSIGASKSPNCVSVAAGDLLGRNDPVETLQKYCERASGGVLFIDEAYAIQSDLRYCSSCISVLLDVMEEERENITIILAGYEAEMTQFLNQNQGLKSRFPVTVHFEDYSVNQLVDIFELLCSKYNFSINEDGMNKLKSVIIDEMAADNFGNARTIRNIFEQTYRLHAENYMRKPEENKKFVFDRNDIASLTVKEDKK